MMYKGKNMTLCQYVNANLKELERAGKRYEESETVAALVMDYYGSMGEFSKRDKTWLKRHDLVDVEKLCYESEEEVVPRPSMWGSHLVDEYVYRNGRFVTCSMGVAAK